MPPAIGTGRICRDHFGVRCRVTDIMADFTLTLPPEEAAHVRTHYAAADVILEYGAGGSTLLAAGMKDKLVFSVESDWHWARRLQERIDLDEKLPSPAILYHVDIGPTGRWGRPLDDSKWQNYHRYPLRIWSEPFFRDPDVILIDGRLRPACLVAACLRARKPVTVLFDDYAGRRHYHVVEKLLAPVRKVGRMAEFRVVPQAWPVWAQDLLIELCTQRSLADQSAA